MIRRSSTALSGKEQDGVTTDLVRVSRDRMNTLLQLCTDILFLQTRNDKYRVSKLPGIPRMFSAYARTISPLTPFPLPFPELEGGLSLLLAA